MPRSRRHDPTLSHPNRGNARDAKHGYRSKYRTQPPDTHDDEPIQAHNGSGIIPVRRQDLGLTIGLKPGDGTEEDLLRRINFPACTHRVSSATDGNDDQS